jgi:mannitol/fructose-specific phosphotransferase system IIA component (Ntr-type)
VLFLSEEGKDEALRALAGVLAAGCGIRDQAELESEIAEREKLMSTGIGMGLAVPHVRLASVRQLTMAVGISRKGISDYASLDDKPVHLVFMIAAPAGQHSDYLRLLSVVSARAKALNGRLLEPANSRDFCRLLTEVEVLDAGEGAKS